MRFYLFRHRFLAAGLVFAACLGLLYLAEEEGRRRQGELVGALLEKEVEKLGIALYSSYFNWTPMYEAISRGDYSFLGKNFGEIRARFPQVFDLSMEEVPPSSDFEVVGVSGNHLVLRFRVTDDEGNRVAGRGVSARVIPQGLLPEVTRFRISPAGKYFLPYGLRAEAMDPPLGGRDILMAVALAVLAYFLFLSRDALCRVRLEEGARESYERVVEFARELLGKGLEECVGKFFSATGLGAGVLAIMQGNIYRVWIVSGGKVESYQATAEGVLGGLRDEVSLVDFCKRIGAPCPPLLAGSKGTVWFPSRGREVPSAIAIGVGQPLVEGSISILLDLIASEVRRRSLEEECLLWRRKDPETGLLNRDALVSMAEQVFDEADARGEEVGVLVIGMSGKSPQEVGEAVRRVIRHNDRAGRYDQERVVALLRWCPPEGARAVADRLSGILGGVNIWVASFPRDGVQLRELVREARSSASGEEAR